MKNLNIISLLISLTLGIYIVIGAFNNQQIVFVDSKKVFDEFNLKKELENQLKNIENKRLNFLDSLKSEIQILSLEKNKNEERLKNLNELYNIKANEFEYETTNLTQIYNDKIWNKINALLDDFAREKKYSFIIEKSPNRGVFYGNDKADITNEFTTYINAKNN